MRRGGAMRKTGAALAVLGAAVLGLPWLTGVAAASGATGFSSTTGVPSIAPSTTNEACQSYVVGANTPKVFMNGTGTFQPGGTINYTVGLSPAASKTYNTRICVVTEDINGNYVATLGEAEYGNLTVPPYGPGFDFSYTLPSSLGTVGSQPGQAYQVCSVAKTQEAVNGGGADRKSAPACSPIATTPDLQLTKAPDASPVQTGSRIGFTITASNTGAGDATGYTLTDPLPTNLGVTGWTLGTTTGIAHCSIDTATETLTCTAAGGTLAAGTSFSVDVYTTAGATSTGSVVNTATETSTNGGTVPATATVVVQNAPAPNLEITKVADHSTVDAGSAIGFTVTASNIGNAAATNYSLTDVLPSGLGLGAWTLDSQTGAGNCTLDAATETVTCVGSPANTLAAGATFSFHVTNTSGATSGGSVSNTASETSGNGGTVQATAAVTVVAPDLQVSKTAISPSVTVGAPLGFNITATNSGAGDATGFVLTDNLPVTQGLRGHWTETVTSGTGNCAIKADVLTCTGNPPGTLAAGATFTVQVTSTGANTPGTVSNTATVSATNAPTTSSTATVVVSGAVVAPGAGNTGDIALAKSGPNLAHVGDTVPYTLTVTNPGTVNLVNVVLTDPVCDTVPVLVSEVPNHGTTLDPGDVWTYTCSHVVTAKDSNPLLNTATVTGVDTTGATQTATASHSVTIIHPSIAITKTATPNVGTPGTPVTFTYVVTDTGDTTLAPVVVTDDILGAVGTIPSLAAGASATVTKGSTIGTHAITNIGTATGTDPLGAIVKATASARTTPHANAAATGTAPPAAAPKAPTPIPAVVQPAAETPAPAPAAAPNKILAYTGADASETLMTGGAAIGIGALLILASRRRRDEE